MMNYDTSVLDKDYSTTGVRLEGPWENDRNRCHKQLIRDIVTECFPCVDTPYVGHHIMYEIPDKSQGAIGQEIPSIDTMIFDHVIARKVWGDGFKQVLMQLACEPVETRDQLLSDLYYGRPKV